MALISRDGLTRPYLLAGLAIVAVGPPALALVLLSSVVAVYPYTVVVGFLYAVLVYGELTGRHAARPSCPIGIAVLLAGVGRFELFPLLLVGFVAALVTARLVRRVDGGTLVTSSYDG